MSCGEVTAKNTSVPFVTFNTSVVLVWKVTAGTDQRTWLIRLFILPNVREPEIRNMYNPNVQRQWKHLFGDRLSATFNEAGESNFILTLKEIQYNENFTFQVRADFEKGVDYDGRSVADIHINNVYGMLICLYYVNAL